MLRYKTIHFTFKSTTKVNVSTTDLTLNNIRILTSGQQDISGVAYLIALWCPSKQWQWGWGYKLMHKSMQPSYISYCEKASLCHKNGILNTWDIDTRHTVQYRMLPECWLWALCAGFKPSLSLSPIKPRGREACKGMGGLKSPAVWFL